MANAFKVDLEQDDTEILKSFLIQAVDFSKLITLEPSSTGDFFGIRIQYVRGQVDKIRETAAMVGDLALQTIERFEEESRAENFLPRLYRAGLDGFQLRTKMSVLNEWASHFLDDSRSKIKALRMVLDNAISILGSITSELPYFEFFKEMYELIRNAIQSINHSKEK